MKVDVWVETNATADVSLQDCISELLRATEGDAMLSEKRAAIDGATQILAAIGPDTLSLNQLQGAKTLLRERLGKWIEAIQERPTDAN